MSFPKYAQYRESSVGWLGLVPVGWRVLPLKAVARVINGFPFDARLFDPAEGVPLVRIRDLNQSVPNARYQGEFVSAASIDNNDVLIGMDGDFNVGRWLGEVPALLNQRMCCVRADSPTVTRYLEYVLPTPLKSINDVTYATTVKHLSSFDVLKISVAMPPSDSEIDEIVAFLDRETAKIDALVEEQRRLIELLKEKRQAVISRAVTKGLNPNAPMKDSGVEWLGKVPAHWGVKRIKQLVNCFEQGWSPQCEGYPVESDQEWGVLKVGCVNGGSFRPDENKTLPSSLEPQPSLSLLAGDLLISRANTRDLVGGAAVVNRDYANLLLCDKLYRLRFDRACSSRFIGLYLGTSGVRGQIELSATGASSSMLNIGQSTILELDVALPGLEEQEAITAYVDQICSQLDALTVEAESATALLQERRAALLSAAVTGKIDVRDSADRLAAKAEAQADRAAGQLVPGPAKAHKARAPALVKRDD